MKKPWSISTTVRNPKRIRDFLKALKILEGEEWTRENQRKYQIILIQYKVYGYGRQQFYNGLSNEQLSLMENPDLITFEQAEAILETKNYVGGSDMRGRQSFNPIEKMGLAYIDNENKIKISTFGEYFLQDDYDLGEVFFRSFIKWQLPNPDSRDFRLEDGYNIKPFIGTLHLIKKVNEKWANTGNSPVGINRKEFELFVPTLINYENIEDVSQKIIELRNNVREAENNEEYLENYTINYIRDFLNSDNPGWLHSTLHNIRDYTDNIVRYFRLTRYIYIRGSGYYIDLEPRRRVEINSLLAADSARIIEFESRDRYIRYITDINQPILPWETEEKLTEIVLSLLQEIRALEEMLGITELERRDTERLTLNELKNYIDEIRVYRRKLQETKDQRDSQLVENLVEYIDKLRNIRNLPNSALLLEKYISLGLNSINDAIRIKPNYPVGDDNEPTHNAPSGVPDIECYYITNNSICEVTMLTSRNQWYYEGQPVMRHLRDFEDLNPDKAAYCMFIAPRLHRDTINTFWMSVKYEYEGEQQKIIPLSLSQFISILETLLKLKQNRNRLTHEQLFGLFNNIIDVENVNDSNDWISKISEKFEVWKNSILNN
ncbi:hypothetical protein ES705_11558 [subsurface metagenome]